MEEKAMQKTFQGKMRTLSEFYQDEYEKLARSVLQKHLSKEDFINIFEKHLNESIKTHNDFLNEIGLLEEKKRQEIESAYSTIREVASETKRLLSAMSITVEVCTAFRRLFFDDFLDFLYYSLAFESNNFFTKKKPPTYFLTYSARRSIRKHIIQKDEQITEINVREIVDSFYKKCENFSGLSKHKISIIQKNEIDEVKKLQAINEKILEFAI